MGKSKKYVAKDIRKMLSLGMFPEGHMDDKETCLMLSNEIYKTYLDSEKARLLKESEAQKKEDVNANKPEEILDKFYKAEGRKKSDVKKSIREKCESAAKRNKDTDPLGRGPIRYNHFKDYKRFNQIFEPILLYIKYF